MAVARGEMRVESKGQVPEASPEIKLRAYLGNKASYERP